VRATVALIWTLMLQAELLFLVVIGLSLVVLSSEGTFHLD
jgi:hypothetical protein